MLLIVGAAVAWLALGAQEDFAREADQRLHVSLAQNLATEFAPFIHMMPDYEGVEETIHNLMVYNPRIEIYVLDTTGTILSYFSDPAKIVRERVDLGPVHTFLQGDHAFPLLGPDPRSLTESKPFSVAPIDLGNRQGFLYVILGGELVEASLSAASGSYITRFLLLAIGMVVLASAVIGLGLFFLHTRRFQRMQRTVRRFSEGDLDARIDVTGGDDVADLSRTFNDMASRITAVLEELRFTDQQRREQVANISHDLKTPLSSILGFVETIHLKGDTLSVEDRDQYLRVIGNNAETLSRLVAQLSELARLESLSVELNPEPFNLEELVQDVALAFMPMAEEKGVVLETELSGQQPRVLADLGMMERVLSNLIRNAVQYTDPGGTISVVVGQHEDQITVAVKDTGCGIAQQDLAMVTERFYRVDKSRQSGAGMGLGLAIVEMILRLHGASLSIQSELNRGTTLSFGLTPMAG